MKPTVYVETSIFGYLAMRGSRLLEVTANQQVTRDWWERRHDYDLFASVFVLDECSDGDPSAAQERLAFLRGIRLLPASDEIRSLAKSFLAEVPLPDKAAVDALHVSVATVNRIEYLLTWNCRHIANAALRPAINRVCRKLGYEPPVICTPPELLGLDDGLGSDSW
jgi:hypothetical protein